MNSIFNQFIKLFCAAALFCNIAISSECRMHSFDVGQANFILLTKGKNALFVDCGAAGTQPKSTWLDQEVNKKLVRSCLQDIEYASIMLTHDHGDHTNLLESLQSLISDVLTENFDKKVKKTFGGSLSTSRQKDLQKEIFSKTDEMVKQISDVVSMKFTDLQKNVSNFILSGAKSKQEFIKFAEDFERLNNCKYSKSMKLSNIIDDINLMDTLDEATKKLFIGEFFKSKNCGEFQHRCHETLDFDKLNISGRTLSKIYDNLFYISECFEFFKYTDEDKLLQEEIEMQKLISIDKNNQIQEINNNFFNTDNKFEQNINELFQNSINVKRIPVLKGWSGTLYRANTWFDDNVNSFFDGVKFVPLRPEKYPLSTGTLEHRTNLMLTAQYGDNCILFTGDADKALLNSLNDEEKNFNINLLKKVTVMLIPHHGSSTEESTKWFEIVEKKCNSKFPLLGLISSNPEKGGDKLPKENTVVENFVFPNHPEFKKISLHEISTSPKKIEIDSPIFCTCDSKNGFFTVVIPEHDYVRLYDGISPNQVKINDIPLWEKEFDAGEKLCFNTIMEHLSNKQNFEAYVSKLPLEDRKIFFSNFAKVQSNISNYLLDSMAGIK